MDFDQSAGGETIGAVDADEVWSRFEAFLTAAVPVAESAGVRLCAHQTTLRCRGCATPPVC